MVKYVVHDAIGRTSQNYIVQVPLDVYGLPDHFEQLWLRPLSDGRFVVACIPFCVDGLSFGDVVVLDDDGKTIARIAEPSGRRVLRILLTADDAQTEALRGEIKQLVDELGIKMEIRVGRLIVFDISADTPTDRLFELLRGYVQAGLGFWEWGDKGATGSGRAG